MHIIVEFIIFLLIGFITGFLFLKNPLWGIIALFISLLILYAFLINKNWFKEFNYKTKITIFLIGGAIGLIVGLVGFLDRRLALTLLIAGGFTYYIYSSLRNVVSPNV